MHTISKHNTTDYKFVIYMNHVTTSSNMIISAVSYFLRLPNYAQLKFIFLEKFLACTSGSKIVSVHLNAAAIL